MAPSPPNRHDPLPYELAEPPTYLRSGLTTAERGCKVSGCDRVHHSRGLCRPHLNQWLLDHDPEWAEHQRAMWRRADRVRRAKWRAAKREGGT